MQKNGQRSGVGGEDDNLRDSSVESLGSLVGTLLQLTEMGRLPVRDRISISCGA